VEHMRNLEMLPLSGFTFTAAPVKVKGMGSFPVRAFATIPIGLEDSVRDDGALGAWAVRRLARKGRAKGNFTNGVYLFPSPYGLG